MVVGRRRPGGLVVVADLVFEQQWRKQRLVGRRFVGPHELHPLAAVAQLAVVGSEERDLGAVGGGVGGGIDVGCDEGRCVDPAVASSCREAIAQCIAAEPANEEQCVVAGNLLFCNEVGVVRVFVTSVEYKGNFPGGPGLEGADASCTETATNAGLTGTWTAWLSDDTTNAVDRIPDGEYRLFDGTLVANDKTDLTDGELANPIIVREDGTSIPGGALEVWTGTGADGTNSGLGTCNNWTDNTNGMTAQSGFANAADATWTDRGVAEENCDVFNKLYCFAN